MNETPTDVWRTRFAAAPLLYFVGLIGLSSYSASWGQMIDHGDGTVTDTSTGLMWLKDAANGASDWDSAQQWAENLVFANHSDWRLPSALNMTDGQLCNSQPAGANCTDSEFGSLYFGYGLANLVSSGIFQNFQGVFWTATEFPADASKAMTQDFLDGGQNPLDKTLQLGRWAVRDADEVGASELIDNGDGTVTDLAQCLTWTKDANLPCTLGYGSSAWQGACWFHSLTEAEAWAESLDYAGHQDWRLVSEVLYPGNSELDTLFYDTLGNPPGGPLTNTGPFVNVLQSTEFKYYDANINLVTAQRVHDVYWISAAPVNPGREPSFNIANQTYGDHFMTDAELFSAWAVRDACDIVPKACNDNVDNDNDGLIDAQDPGCENPDDNDEKGGLVDNNDGTISDPDVCLMWSKDANLAGTHLDHDAALSFADNATLAGHTDWRLPDALNFDGSGPCVTAGPQSEICSESELGHLYYSELGNPPGGPLQDTGPFTNLTPDWYWTTNTVGSTFAYEFSFLTGSQANGLRSNQNRALIVRDLVAPTMGCTGPTTPQCSDGIDNDGDGIVDYPNDSGCCSADDPSEGFRLLRSRLTQAMTLSPKPDIAKYFGYQTAENAKFHSGFSSWFFCKRPIPGMAEIEDLSHLCFEGAITSGAPQRCPPLDCTIDGPGCMDPYGFRRVTIPEEAYYLFAQRIEGQLSDPDFDARIAKLVDAGRMTMEPDVPRRTRYLPLVSLGSASIVAFAVVVIAGVAFMLGRRVGRR